MPKSRVNVPLPNLMPEVGVPPHLAGPLTQIINAGARGVTTMELQKEGCLHTSRAVAKLKKLGAQIETVLCEDTDAQGLRRSRIARYRYWGWSLQETSADIETNEFKVHVCR